MKYLKWISLLTLAFHFCSFGAEPAPSAPQQVLLKLVQAVERGSATNYLDCYLFAPEESKFKQVLARTVIACGRLKIAAEQKLGTNAVSMPPFPISLPLSAVQKATTRIEGTNAFVDVGKSQPIEMVKVGNDWKTTVSGFFHRDAEGLCPMVEAFAVGLENAAAGISNGSYRSMGEAMMAIKVGKGSAGK